MEALIQEQHARNCLFTIADVSELLCSHDVTLRDWARAGRMPGLRIGGQWRFDPTEPAAWVEVRRMG
ncbi:MAG: helix-turn-helix domain-containing protein [Acidobacteriia bacterium]|nr:helix-turn-helix domain-containing protein [Terriglobia bacterium]